ncbi:MAG: Ankyrin [Myxococcaceae bacterium]|nr:Ankyrin [Myxococcaceae bacterium]
MLAALAVVWMSLPAAAPTAENCTPLQLAVVRGERDAVQRLAGRRMLGMGAPAAPLEERGDRGPCQQRTALMIAAERGQLEIAKLLISSGAKVDATGQIPELGEAEIDARCLAIANGRAALVAALEQAGAQDRPCTENARLFAAIRSGDGEAVTRQLRAHPGAPTLEAALRSLVGERGKPRPPGPVVASLVKAGLERKLDFAPVYDAAISAGDVSLVTGLQAAGATLSGSRQLSRALGLGHGGLVASLLAAGARTDTTEARAAILQAVRDHQEDVLAALLSAGYRGDEETPLLLTAIRYYPPIVPAMVKAGVAVELDDDAGATPLMAAAASDRLDLVQLLLERGASPRTGDIICDTAFDAARAPLRLRQHLLEQKLPVLDQPVVPGRAARRMGVTCGPARLSLTFEPGYEVYLPDAELPMGPAMEYRLHPGVHLLRVKHLPSGTERQMKVTLAPGLNALTEKFLDFSRKK